MDQACRETLETAEKRNEVFNPGLFPSHSCRQLIVTSFQSFASPQRLEFPPGLIFLFLLVKGLLFTRPLGDGGLQCHFGTGT